MTTLSRLKIIGLDNDREKIKWGIAGLGNIAHRFAQDLTSNSQCGELQAVAARDVDKAERFATRYKAVSHYGDYEQLATDPTVDIVYVATIHPYHRPLVELFLSHHKHVLVEKPAFTNYQDWQDMQKLAKDNGVLLLEAMKTVAFPAYRELKTFMNEHKIVVDSIEASFGNESVYDPNIFVFNPELSGERHSMSGYTAFGFTVIYAISLVKMSQHRRSLLPQSTLNGELMKTWSFYLMERLKEK